MVTSVNASVLAALQAQEKALANRAADTPAPSRDTVDDAPPARDPAVVYAGADGSPGLSGLLAVQDGLNRAASIADVGLNAGQTIAGLLNLLRAKVTAAQGGEGDPATLNGDYQELLATIDQLAKSAAFQGVTVLDGKSSDDLTFKTDPSGDSTLSLTPQDFTVGGPVLSLAGTDLSGSSDDLADLLSQVDAAGGRLSAQLSQMSAQSDQIQGHLGVLSQLAGASGQPDLDADSARLMALQVQQALAGQSQAVANQGPQALLSLFRAT
jgi:flagellin